MTVDPASDDIGVHPPQVERHQDRRRKQHAKEEPSLAHAHVPAGRNRHRTMNSRDEVVLMIRRRRSIGSGWRCLSLFVAMFITPCHHKAPFTNTLRFRPGGHDLRTGGQLLTLGIDARTSAAGFDLVNLEPCSRAASVRVPGRPHR